MGSVIVIQSLASAAGGSDVTPDAINWGDISQTNTNGYEISEEKTVAGIDALITLRATATGGAYLQWIKNGVAVEAAHASPALVSINVSDNLRIAVYNGYDFPSGRYDTGTITITNDSDSGASIDTLTYVVQYVYAGGGSSDPGDLVPGPGQKPN